MPRCVRLALLFLALAVSCAGIHPAAAGLKPVANSTVPRLYAIAIGTNHFKDPIPQLKYGISDAHRVGDALRALKNRANIEKLVVLDDPDRFEILSAVGEMAKAAHAADAAMLVYWAGQSITLASQDLELIATDTVVDASSDPSRSMSLQNAIAFTDDLLPLFDRGQRVIFIGDSCHVGEALAGEASLGWPKLTVLAASKTDELAFEYSETSGGVLSYVLEKALREPIPDIDGDGLLSMDELFHDIYPQVVRLTKGQSHPAMFGRYSHRTTIASALRASDAGQRGFELKIEAPELKSLPRDATIKINGQALSKPPVLLGERVVLDEADAPKTRKGLNYVEIDSAGDTVAKAIRSYNLWLEADTLKAFETPYKKSHAVVISIGDFERKKDPKKRGPTGLDPVEHMVDTAHELAETLRGLGFDKVHELYDADATKANIDALLSRYWKGEEFQDVDRLFIYYGAHGIPYTDSAGKPGVLLATYDYDEARLRSSNYLASDLLERHADQIAAKHVMFAIDACSAGFARFGRLGDGPVEKASVDKDAIRKLQTFRDEAEKKGRNVLVAGRDDQSAIVDQGRSIFAMKLIKALSGKADPHNKGYWRFSDVQSWVKNEVSMEAAEGGRRKQQPTSWSLNAFGDGEMLFYLAPQVTAAVVPPLR